MYIREIAEKLYDLASDIDVNDYAETKDETVTDIAKDLELIKGTLLLEVLDLITERN